MVSQLEKQGKKYTFRYYDNKRQKRKTLDAGSLAEAKKQRDKFLSMNAARLQNGRLFATFSKKILEHIKANLSPATADAYKRVLVSFREFRAAGDKLYLAQVSQKTSEDYKMSRIELILIFNIINH